MASAQALAEQWPPVIVSEVYDRMVTLALARLACWLNASEQRPRIVDH
ncbi:hypothetical protein [Paraburkholderia dilworthii]|nr:hypothetical protein [Paraburkholderia dilworthii]